MMSGRDMISVACQHRGTFGRSMAVWFGKTETIQDPRSGDMITREVREFMPASVCFYDEREGRLYLPRWLAKKRGLV